MTRIATATSFERADGRLVDRLRLRGDFILRKVPVLPELAKIHSAILRNKSSTVNK